MKAIGEPTAAHFQKFAAASSVAAPSTRVILDKIKSLSQQEKQKEKDTHDRGLRAQKMQWALMITKKCEVNVYIYSCKFRKTHFDEITEIRFNKFLFSLPHP